LQLEKERLEKRQQEGLAEEDPCSVGLGHCFTIYQVLSYCSVVRQEIKLSGQTQ